MDKQIILNSDIIPANIADNINKAEFRDIVETNARFQELMMMYRCAIREVQTKLEVLNDEFKTRSKRNPIESISSRIKSPASIFDKLQRRGFELSIQSIMDNLNDVAGIRVVCPFINDIYEVANLLVSQDDVEVMEVKDYIKNPKPNGYRSLHYVLIIPIFLSTGKEYMKVEVQIRTIAMNFWASLEHQMHYKQFKNDEMPEIVNDLTKCAETIYNTDVHMQEIREDIHSSFKKEESGF
jgi:putative GTP pyrophosphokinase